MEMVLFAGFALVAAVAAVLVVTRRHAVYSALYLVITMVALAGLYVLLEGYFIWIIQIIVYAGAIMVLFLFVIMLLDVRHEDILWTRRDWGQLVPAALLSLVLLAEMLLALGRGALAGARAAPAPSHGFGTTQTVGRMLFTDYLFPFEITSVILLVAMVGALVLAKRQFK
jgi:NADH-quinone oxidoreductase subunit J